MAVFRVERTKDFTIMSNHHLRNRDLSLKAKGMLSLMLSLPKDWDYTMAGLAHICRDGMSSIRATIIELEEHGYLKRRRLRNDKGQLTETEYTILEFPIRPQTASESHSGPICENRTQASQPICDFPTLDSPMLGFPVEEKPTEENQTQLNIQQSRIQKSSIHGSSIHPINPARDGENGIDVYREIIAENISYNFLRDSYGADRAESVLELLTETVCQSRKSVRIGREDMPAEVVRSRLLKLDHCHVEYVFERMDANTTKINNIRAYLLTSLYRAPVTIEPYYRAEVNHDLNRGGDF